ncbi:MAG: hypothetical protein JST39_17370 [Bacteroidetes bacterium]|nr:hypothetical protein [Bacteroidota bacterium]
MAEQQTPVATDNGKTVALLSYITIIGWIIALIQHNNNKTELGAFHLRQTLAMFVIGIVLWIVQIFMIFIPFIGWIINLALLFAYLGLFVLWILGLISAINGEKKPVPVIGEKAQQWFHSVG